MVLFGAIGRAAFGIALTIVVTGLLVQYAVASARLEFQRKAVAVGELVRAESDRLLTLVEYIGALHLASQHVDGDELRTFVEALRIDYPTVIYGVLGVEAGAADGDLLVWVGSPSEFARATMDALRPACGRGEPGAVSAHFATDAEGKNWVGLAKRFGSAPVRCAVVLSPSGVGVDRAFLHPENEGLNGYLFRAGQLDAAPWSCFVGGEGMVACPGSIMSLHAITSQFVRVWNFGPIAQVAGAPSLVLTPSEALTWYAIVPLSVWLVSGLGGIGSLLYAVLHHRVALARIEVALRDRRYRELIASAPIALIEWDESGRMLEWNPAATRLFGALRPGPVDRQLAALAPGADEDATRTSEFIRHEFVRADGTSVPVEVLVTSAQLDDRLTHMAFVRDASSLRAAEQARARAERVVGAAELASGFAHDLNNLLTVVSGNLELIRPVVASNPEASEDTAAAMSAVRRGAELVRAMHALARRREVDVSTIEIDRVVAQALPDLRRVAGPGIGLSLESNATGCHVTIDPSQFANALTNLVINARQAMLDGGSVVVRTGMRVFEGDTGEGGLDTGRYALVEVVDDGPGMPPEVVARAFEPFFTTKDAEGTGLGLSMVRGFARRFGGDAVIHSVPGRGTTIRIYLAATPAPTGPITSRSADDSPR